MKVRKAVIPVAGLGVRFLPYTKTQPKEMLPIVDKPALQYIIEEAVESGIKEILLVTGKGKGAIEDYFDRAVELEVVLEKRGNIRLLEEIKRISELANIYYVRQKEPLGLGHAIFCAKSFVGNEPFAVLLGDDIIHAAKPCLKQMLEVYEKFQTNIVGVQKVPWCDVTKYGIVHGEKMGERLYKVKDLIEKPLEKEAPSNIAILGRYILSSVIFDVLENVQPGVGEEIQLTDALRKLIESERIYAYNFVGKRYDVGNKQGFLEAIVEFALRREDLREDFWSYLMKIVKEGG